MTFRRATQTITLLLFIFLWEVVASAIPILPLDLFLLLDPSLTLVTAISARVIGLTLIPALMILLLSLLLGRFFCGYICPMGTTLDISDWVFRPRKRISLSLSHFKKVKYLVLVFILISALFSVSYVFIASPLSLITRFYRLLVNSMVTFIADGLLEWVRPLAEWLDIRAIAFLQIEGQRFSTLFFILGFFVSLFVLARLSPRFWCRYLCPSGAILALFSKKPLVRRRVSEKCTSCGICARACPMLAIDFDDFKCTHHSECLVCRTCKYKCPENAISFIRPKQETGDEYSLFLPSRRQFILSGAAGAGVAITGLTGLNSLYGKPGPGQVAPEGLVRPPGSLPEMDFLSRCVRCGECMSACPTNTLQPIWFEAGMIGLFSPALTPRRGFCNPECHECGLVCPTGAIPHLNEKERIWAKTGTAMINRQKCLAWEEQKPCLVCDEVCPFKAVEFKRIEGNPVAVPEVNETKCAGCGYCEHYCPVQNQAAIIVTPNGSLRLAKGSYEEQGRLQGLDLSIRPKGEYGYRPPSFLNSTQTAPGFEEDQEGNSAPALAPGFDEEE
jgi:MauM/NapG family ferredoxin protein